MSDGRWIDNRPGKWVKNEYDIEMFVLDEEVMSDDRETTIVNRFFTGTLVPEDISPKQQEAIDEFIRTPDPRFTAVREAAKVAGPVEPEPLYELNCSGCQVPLMRIGVVETIGPVRTVVALCGVCFDKQAIQAAAWSR